MRLSTDNPGEELLAAALKPSYNDAAFAKTMFDTLSSRMKIDSASLNFAVVEPPYILPELKCYFHRQPEIMGRYAQKISRHDAFSPNLLTHPFVAIDGGDVIDLDEFHEHPLYLTHCRYFDVENAMAVAAAVPGHSGRYIMLYFYLSDLGRRFRKEDVCFAQQIFPLIVSIWLYRLGFMCAETLVERCRLLQKFSAAPELCRLIRLVVQEPVASNKDYGKILGRSERTIENQMNRIFEKLEIGGVKSKKIALFRRFQFLEH